MRHITIALAKGRLAENSMSLLEKCQIFCPDMRKNTRKLLFSDQSGNYKFTLVKASDVPVYVEYGAADIGIVGKDTILEEGRNVYEMLDLHFGKCIMAVCAKADFDRNFCSANNLRVATKYPNIARDYFHVQKGQTVELIKLNGSVELAPLMGLSEVIVDIVESGKTLHENGLAVIEPICDISARLIVNRVSLKTERERIMDLIGNISDINHAN